MQFIPIDEKDTSQEYRKSVWAAVQSSIDEKMTPVLDHNQLGGAWKTWLVDLEEEGPFYRFHVFSQRVAIDRKGIVATEAYSVPSPGILTIGKRSYHCAFTVSNRLVLFNGDSSILRVGRKIRDDFD